MQTATVEEVQAHLPKLLEELGENQELIILADGKPVGRLFRAALPKGVPLAGRGKGKLTILADDDEHLKDFEDYMP